MAEEPSVTRFREFLRIDSAYSQHQGKIIPANYESCIEWLRKQASDIGLEFNIVRFEAPNLFAVWLTWPGKDPSLKSIVLNSHLDVVPVEPSSWSYPPFGAEKTENGNIYARGSQDMKCVGIQYLEAIRVLKAKGFVPLRTVHCTYVPDEETGGYLGMCPFIKTKEFQNLRIGFGLDEGIASPTEVFEVFFGERSIWQVRFTATGPTGHGSMLFTNTAGEKIHRIMTKLLGLRAEQKAKLDSDPNIQLGDVTTVNLNILEGGLGRNVVPPELHATFDIRITPTTNLDEFKKMLDDLCEPGVTYRFDQRFDAKHQTKLDDDNIWWKTFEKTCSDIGLKLRTKIFPAGTDANFLREIFPAATDIRYLRQIGIPALGFSPMNHTPVLLHDHDEYLNEKIYLKGIEIYVGILEKIVNVPKQPTDTQ